MSPPRSRRYRADWWLGCPTKISLSAWTTSPSSVVAATIVREDGTSSSPQVGSAIGIANFSVVFGAADGSGQDASVVFDSADHPLIGLTLTTTELSGTALAVARAAFLDPETYARAGWDLDRVWVAPTETSVPTLR